MLQTDNIPTRQDEAEDYSSELAMIAENVGALVDPGQAAYNIGNVLETLHTKGTDPEALDIIQSSAESLLETSDQLLQAFKTAVDLAHAIQAQRDQTREALDKLRQAIEEEDPGYPEIEQLIESIQEQSEEMAQEYFYESWYEMVGDEIAYRSGLNWDIASRLLDILTGGTLPKGHPLWKELAAWVERANVLKNEK